jgi:hypothetical protein
MNPAPTAEETARDLFDRILTEDEPFEPIPESSLLEAVEEGGRHAAAAEAMMSHAEIASIRFLTW